MKTALLQYRNGELHPHPNSDEFDMATSQLVICFGAKSLLDAPFYHKLKDIFPVAEIVMCSTAGEIFGTEVFDDTISITAINFSGTTIVTHAVNTSNHTDSFDAGKSIVQQFDKEDLTYLLVLSEGSNVNGSELIRGINDAAPGGLLVTGGLAGDGAQFTSTLVGLNGAPSEEMIVGIGFYGNKLVVTHGSQGGWETFGLERTVTSAKGNVLYEIDDQNALSRYKKYLGAEAHGLPGSALLFPLSVTLPESGEEVVRTILSIDEDEGSMTFAGDIPEGAKVRFMKANFDRITNAASIAAVETRKPEMPAPKLALLISCVGRKLVLQTRIDEEVEAVSEVLGSETLLTGFYSYGEISPVKNGGSCQLHNQTMTITTFYEVE